MKKLLIDTNIVIDLLAKREPDYLAAVLPVMTAEQFLKAYK